MPQKPTSPAWERIATDLIERIARGQYGPGDKLPSAQQLADQHKVARATAVRAMDRLHTEGYVVARPGYGTFVVDKLPGLNRATRLREIAQELTEIADSLNAEPPRTEERQ